MSPSITKSRCLFGTSMPIADLPGIGRDDAHVGRGERVRDVAREVQDLVDLGAGGDLDLVHRDGGTAVGRGHAGVDAERRERVLERLHVSLLVTPSFVEGGAVRSRSSGGSWYGPVGGRDRSPRGFAGTGASSAARRPRSRAVQRLERLGVRQRPRRLGEPEPFGELGLVRLRRTCCRRPSRLSARPSASRSRCAASAFACSSAALVHALGERSHGVAANFRPSSANDVPVKISGRARRDPDRTMNAPTGETT